jgi:hypothetical protein
MTYFPGFPDCRMLWMKVPREEIWSRSREVEREKKSYKNQNHRLRAASEGLSGLGAGLREKELFSWGLVLILAWQLIFFFLPVPHLEAQDFRVGKRFLCRA